MENSELKLIKKAFRVWHEGMLNDNPHEGYRIEDIPVVHADTPGEAKTMASEPYDWTLDDEEPKYTDLKVRRAAGADKMLFEGREVSRWQMEIIKNERKRVEKRTKAIEKYPNNTHFYVQDSRSYVGNSAVWWGKNSNGYVTDISKAELYTKKEILNRFVNGRESDVIWESSHVLTAVRQHVDSQYLSKEYCT